MVSSRSELLRRENRYIIVAVIFGVATRSRAKEAHLNDFAGQGFLDLTLECSEAALRLIG